MKGEVVVDQATQSLLKDDSKVRRGKNGRLFLDNDRNRVILQHTGQLLFSKRQLRNWQLVLENRIAWLDELGVPYFFVVPPNAHSVYPEDLPDDVPSGSLRPVQQLISHLEDSGSFAGIIYPLDDLLAAKANRLLYCKTDPHWSAYGAFIAYRLVAGEVASLLPINQVSEEDVSFEERAWTGELGFKMEPKEEAIQIWASVERPVARLLSDNRVFNTGMMVATECPDAPPTTCLLLGDSFARQTHNFFAASFRRLVFAHVPTLDYDLVREERPDVVVSVLNERFLIVVPDDIGGPSARDLAQQKMADGQLREEEIKNWPKADGS